MNRKQTKIRSLHTHGVLWIHWCVANCSNTFWACKDKMITCFKWLKTVLQDFRTVSVEKMESKIIGHHSTIKNCPKQLKCDILVYSSIFIHCPAKTWIYLTPYVCTEWIFDSRPFMYNKIFLKKIFIEVDSSLLYFSFGIFWVQIG